MLKRKKNKLWQGKYISIRSTEIPLAIKKGGMEIQYGNEVMILDTDFLKQLKVDPESRIFKSIYDNTTYKLVDVVWNPNDEQRNLFN